MKAFLIDIVYNILISMEDTMTQIRIVSDLHTCFIPMSKAAGVFESMLPYTTGEKEQILILAGDIVADIHEWVNQIWFDFYTPWFIELGKRFKAVIYVAGNHEFYHSNIVDGYNYLYSLEKQIPNLYIGNNHTTVLDGVRFLGTTLWSDLSGPLDAIFANQISDLEVINGWTVGTWQQAHNEAVAYLTTELAKDFDGKTVVVTHHLPTYMSIQERFRRQGLNCCYASNLDNLIAYNDIDLMIHGHTHNSLDYMAGDTRIIANPYGYYGEMVNHEYNPTLTVDV